MRGLFLVNGRGEVALAQLTEQVSISALRFHRGAGTCVIELTDGTETVLEDELVADVIDALRRNETILIMHTDESSQVTIKDYRVPIAVVE